MSSKSLPGFMQNNTKLLPSSNFGTDALDSATYGLGGSIEQGVTHLWNQITGGAQNPTPPPAAPTQGDATTSGLNDELLNELNLRKSMAQFTGPQTGQSLGSYGQMPQETSVQSAGLTLAG